MKTKLIVSTALLLSLCLSCDKDTLLEPETIMHPKLFPLAEGAKWQFSSYYDYSSSSSSLWVTQKEYGQFTMEVLQEDELEGVIEYELSLGFELDTLYYQKYHFGGGPGDTTYTSYNVFDTTYYRTLVFDGDTLWYKSADSLYMLMPDSGVAGSSVNLEMFTAARYGVFFKRVAYSGSSTDQYVFSGEWLLQFGSEQLTVTVRPKNGGINYIDWRSDVGHNLSIDQRLQFTLKSFSPGTL